MNSWVTAAGGHPERAGGLVDALHEPIADDVYRFLPLLLDDADLDRLHGTNERVALDEHAAAIAFYARLLRNRG